MATTIRRGRTPQLSITARNRLRAVALCLASSLITLLLVSVGVALGRWSVAPAPTAHITAVHHHHHHH